MMAPRIIAAAGSMATARMVRAREGAARTVQLQAMVEQVQAQFLGPLDAREQEMLSRLVNRLVDATTTLVE
jgi:hypothetical protein